MRLLLTILLTQSFALFSQPSGSWVNEFRAPGIPLGNISAMLADDNYVYFLDNTLTGEFGGSPELKKFVRFDGDNYEQLGGLFQCTNCGTGFQTSMIMDNDGNIIIGGLFEGANNMDGSYVESPNLIMWNTSLERWEKLSHGIDALRINALEIIGDTLYIGGQQLVSVTQPNLATLDVSLVAAMNLNTLEWSAMDGGVFHESLSFEPIIYDLEADGLGNLFIGGSANRAGNAGIEYFSVIVWDPTSGSWTNIDGLPFIAFDGATEQSSTVLSLEYDPENGLMYAGGYFGENNAARGFASYDGISWTIIDGIGQRGSTPFLVNEIYKDPLQNRLFVGGDFSRRSASDGNTIGNGIGIYNPSNNSWVINPVNGGVAGNGISVNAFQRFQGNIYFGGRFDGAGGQNAINLARWDEMKVDPLGNGFITDNRIINDLLEWNGKIIAGGLFNGFGTDSTSALAIYDPVTNGWTELGGGIKNKFGGVGIVNDLHIEENRLHIGGDFDRAGGLVAYGFATYDLIDDSWITYGDGLGDVNGAAVQSITIYQGDLVIGGNFSMVDGQSISHLAIYDGTSWTSPGIVDQAVFALFAEGDTLYIGGQFNNVDGNADIRKIGAYDGNGFVPLGKGLINNVFSINKDPQSGAILIGGIFSTAFDQDNNPITVDALVAWNDGTWLPFAGVAGSTRRVEKISVTASGAVYIAGRFETLNGSAVNNLALFDGCDFYGIDGGVAGEDNIIKGLAEVGDRLFIGGSFNSAGGVPSFGFGAFQYNTQPSISDCSPVIAFAENYYSCEQTQDTLSVADNLYLYDWSTGSDSSSAVFNASGIYDLSLYSELGYVVKDTFEFIYEIPQNFSLGNDTTLAGGFAIRAPANEFYTYDWNTGDTTAVITVYSSGEYGLTMTTRGGCVTSDSITVDITAVPLYAGGPGDGYHVSEAINSEQIAIYTGGNGAGYDTDIVQNAESITIFNGGADDGSALDIFLNSETLLVYAGGEDDGADVNRYNNPSTFLIYNGGSDDGYAKMVSANINALNIYSGGQADGYARSFYLSPDVLQATRQGNLESELKIFPNPVTNGTLTITLPRFHQSGKINLVDLQGKQVWVDEFSSTKEIGIDLSNSGLRRGLYLIMIQTEKHIYNSKVIYHY